MPSASSAVHVLAAKSGGSALSLLFPIVLVLGFYLLFMRPARQRQRKAADTRDNVVPGVEVVTTAGLIAHVVSTDDETVTLEIAPGVHAKFLKQAIVRVVLPPQSPDDVGPDVTDETPPSSQG